MAVFCPITRLEFQFRQQSVGRIAKRDRGRERERRENNKFIICIPRAVVNMVHDAGEPPLPSKPPVKYILAASVTCTNVGCSFLEKDALLNSNWRRLRPHNGRVLMYLNKAPNLLSTTCQRWDESLAEFIILYHGEF